MKINIFYQNAVNNFGDMLSIDVVSALLNGNSETVHSKLKRADLVAIGSLGERINDKRIPRMLYKGFKPLDVWGAGFLEDGPVLSKFPKLNVHAARGKLSATRFGSSAKSIALGDPGLLAGKIFNRHRNVSGGSHVICISHLDDTKSSCWISRISKIFENDCRVEVISIQDDVEIICERIFNSSLVVSSALHPIIVGQSFGIPTILVEYPGNTLHPGNKYKFTDYASVFSKNVLPWMDLTRLDSCGLGSKDILDYALEFVPDASEVDLVCKGLEESFPFR